MKTSKKSTKTKSKPASKPKSKPVAKPAAKAKAAAPKAKAAKPAASSASSPSPSAARNGSAHLSALPTTPQDLQKALQEKVRDLIKLAKEQGYVTFDDLDEALPEGVNDPESMESIIAQLRAVEIEIIDSSDVDRVKEVRKDGDEEEEKDEKTDSKLDILDDPVRIVAVDHEGQEHLSTRTQTLGARDVLQHQVQFDLPLAKIKEFRFQTRGFEWAEFPGVALNPRGEPEKRDE